MSRKIPRDGWEGDGLCAFHWDGRYTATINYVSGDRVFVVLVTAPTNPPEFTQMDISTTFEDAMDMAEWLIERHRMGLGLRIKRIVAKIVPWCR
jgi:hypothetical protein